MAYASFIIIFWVAAFGLFLSRESFSHDTDFADRSLPHLEEIHLDLFEVVFLARLISEVPFEITDGKRSIEEQRYYVEQGRSTTMNSKHLTGRAVDVVPIPVRWDYESFLPIAEAMKEASDMLDIPIVWGGDWVTFKDYPHFELKD